MRTETVAAVVRAAGAPFTLETIELDEPRADEVLVRMVATGLCHTDLAARAGSLPFPLPGVLGHEGAGVVQSVGAAVRRVAPGDHVLASFSSCGRCPACVAGHPASCHSFHALNLFGGARPDGSHTLHQGGRPLHGHFFGQSSLARHALVDERCLVKVPDEAPVTSSRRLGCGIQTGAGAVMNCCGRSRAARSRCSAPAPWAWPPSWRPHSGAARIVAVDLVPARLGWHSSSGRPTPWRPGLRRSSRP